MDVDHLASIAAQLVARVRDDDPDANARWLRSVLPDPQDWFRLAFALAAAVPEDRTWLELTAWITGARPRLRSMRDPLVDEIAVERACNGDAVELTVAERYQAIGILLARGLSASAIADRLGCSTRTVNRARLAIREGVNTDVNRETWRETSESGEVAA